jgi:dipeptidyl-peptidase 4
VSDTFPRQYARTQRLSLGEPRNFTVSPDGARVVFARSTSGQDSVNSLWVLDLATGEETQVLDPRTVGADLSQLTAEELRRRERAREGAGGIVTYACDAAVSKAVTVLGGYVVHVDLLSGITTLPDIAPGVFDVRLSPDGSHISYVRGADLCVADVVGNERVIATEPIDTVTWGSAEFIAAEEMGRMRGYWWSPNSQHIAACRVDVADVPIWYIADPAHPERPAVEHRYPAAGSVNATVSLHVLNIADYSRTDVQLDGEWEYLTSVSWSTGGLIAQTQTRDQRHVDVHLIDSTTGASTVIYTDEDEAWVEIVPGAPALLSDARLVTCADRNGVRRLIVDDRSATPDHLQVRGLITVGDTIVFSANEIETPWMQDVYSFDTQNGSLSQLTNGNGMVSASGTADVLITRTSTITSVGPTFAVHHHNTESLITSYAETPLVEPNVRITSVGPRAIPVAILTPRDGSTTKLPVLFDPYGGPHAQRVVASNGAYLSSQWFADQGFVVVIADNVGTPGKGSAWERGVFGDLAQPVLDDQIEIVRALENLEPRADTTRVGIRGWSFGGYLAALAVLRRSDVFHAAIAGAPVTDWPLYDTHYTERYLGNPSIDDSNYTKTSLMEDVDTLKSPLLIIHGLADDNVVAAHTLQLSSALLAAGKAHEVLPLSGVTHMTPQEIVAENLLLHQLDFLRRTLG